jgi:hypothetical protein
MTDPILECSCEVEKLAADNGIKDLAMNVTSVLIYRDSKRETEPDYFEVSGSYDFSNAGGKSTFESKVKEIVGAKSIKTDVRLEIKLKGTKFPTLAQLTPVSKDDKSKTPVDVAPRPGEATLFDFWATSCSVSHGSMKDNEEMLEKHPEWAGKVRIVGVSIDDEIDAPIKRVTEMKWTKVEHYWCPGGWGSTVCKPFGIHGIHCIPLFALVDGTGTIQMTGYPWNMNLEVNLSKFAAEGHFETEESGPKPKTPDYTFEKCTAELDELCKSHPAIITAIFETFITAEFKKHAKGGKYEQGEGLVRLWCTWSQKSKSAFEALKELINTTFASKASITMKDREIPMATLEFGGMCSRCHKSLTVCNQYRCAICQPPAFFCINCVEEKKNPTAITDLPHPHGLYYLQKDSGPVLGEIVVCNLKMGSGTIENKTHSSCGCDFRGLHPEGQSPGPIGIRWKCANCPTVDVCDLCFNIARKPAHPAHAALILKGTETGHDFKTHVYIRQEFVDFLHLPY